MCILWVDIAVNGRRGKQIKNVAGLNVPDAQSSPHLGRLKVEQKKKL